jgi:hypothetical protein
VTPPWSKRFACHAGIPTGIPEERRHGRRRGNLKGRSTALAGGGCRFRARSAALASFGGGLVQEAHGMSRLALDDAELFAGRGVFLAQQKVQAICAALDRAERLPQIVHQAGEFFLTNAGKNGGIAG